MHSKTQINKLGNEIRDLLSANEQIPQTSLDILQEFRTSYKSDVGTVFHVLSNVSKKIRKDRIVSMRLKRIESILSKILRQPTMKLGNMGDIAGCRCIVRTEDAVRQLVIGLSQKLIVKKFNDYLTQSKEDGYRGYHLYVQSPINHDRIIEIQIRTLDAHNWATLVEILDVIFNLKLKEGQIEDDLNELLLLLSRKHSLTLKEMKRIIEIDKNRNIYSNLKDIFIANHVAMRKKWIEVSKRQNDPFFIIEVDEKKESNLLSFANYTDAEKVYYDKFRDNTGSNFVLTHIEKPDFKKICIAYSNYILIRHQYLDDWSFFVKRIIEQNFVEKNRKEFTYYYDYVERNLDDRIDQVQTEAKEFGIVLKEFEDTNQLYRLEPLQEWVEELKHQSAKSKDFKKSLQQMKAKLPENFWSRMFSK